jgi:Na+/proline symporter
VSEQTLWLVAFLALYWAFCLFWGLASAGLSPGPKSFFLADRNLPAWVVVAAGTAICVNGWVFLGYPDLVFRDGFAFTETFLGAIMIALGSAFFLKRQWMLGKRFGYVTPGEMAGHYFGGEVIRLAMLVIALLFAIPFVSMQLGIVGSIISGLSDGVVGRNEAMWVLSAVAFTSVVFGGMRAAAYVGTLQGVLLAAGVVTLGVYAYWLIGGFGPFTQAMGAYSLATALPEGGAPALDAASIFTIPGVIQYTAGLGVEAPAGGLWTAVMILSYCLALMGLTLNPIFSVLAFSSRSPKGFGIQATWATAGLMGGLLLLFYVALGVGGTFLGGSKAVTDAGLAVGNTFGSAVFPGASSVVGAYIASLGDAAPWFAAILVVCAVAAVQSIAAMSASATSTLIVRDVFKRYIDPKLDIERQRLYARISIGLIIVIAQLMQSFAPQAAVALGALALGFGLQLLPVLAGICWIPWITRPAAAVGLVTGMIFVLFTENFGIGLAAFFGLDLPWGRWPWTIHSAGWGLFANIIVVIVISLISQRQEERTHRRAFHDFLKSHAALPVNRHNLRLVAWAVALAWMFFAIGPGAVIGNVLLGKPDGGMEAWPLGVPPLWAWQFIWWALGVLLVWFLAFHMGMATMPSKFINLATKAERAQPAPSVTGTRIVILWFWIVAVGAAIATLLNWSFG